MDPKKTKKEKVLTFSVKTRQKHKHMTSVAGLELFGLFPFLVLIRRCRHQGGNEGIWKEILKWSVGGEECREPYGDYGSGRYHAGPWSLV